MARRTIHVPPPEFRISSAEVQRRLNCTRRSVYRYAAEGRLTVWKLGPKTNAYDVREVEALVTRKTFGQAAS